MYALYLLITIGSILLIAGCYDALQAKDRRGLRDDHEQFRDYLNYTD